MVRAARMSCGPTTSSPTLYVFAVLFLGLGQHVVPRLDHRLGGELRRACRCTSTRPSWCSTPCADIVPADWVFWVFYPITVVVFLILHAIWQWEFKSLILIIALVAAYLALEIWACVREGKPWQGQVVDHPAVVAGRGLHHRGDRCSGRCRRPMQADVRPERLLPTARHALAPAGRGHGGAALLLLARGEPDLDETALDRRRRGLSLDKAGRAFSFAWTLLDPCVFRDDRTVLSRSIPAGDCRGSKADRLDACFAMLADSVQRYCELQLLRSFQVARR
jgi:hypothetical protein